MVVEYWKIFKNFIYFPLNNKTKLYTDCKLRENIENILLMKQLCRDCGFSVR